MPPVWQVGWTVAPGYGNGMSGIVRPKGRAAAAVYWRRRLVLLAVVLLAVAGAFKLVGGGDDPEASAEASASSTHRDDGGSADSSTDESSDQQTDDTGTGRDEPSRGGSARQSSEREVPVRLGNGGAACDPSTVMVRPSLAPDTYAGDTVTLRLGLSTVGNAACVLEFGDRMPLVSVSDGDELIWTSQRCDDLIEASEVRLEPGWTTYVDAQWSGRASGNRCGENADFAAPGTYQVQAAVLAGEPSKADITLPEEPAEKSDEDSGDKNSDGKNSDGDSDRESSDEQNSENDQDSADEDSTTE